jgi:hypothetical protein
MFHVYLSFSALSVLSILSDTEIGYEQKIRNDKIQLSNMPNRDEEVTLTARAEEGGAHDEGT